jgi:glutamate:GABA antiporter
VSDPKPADPKSQLRRVMGFWDVLLFNIAGVLGPRWIAAAAHNGTSSISLWVLAAFCFFLPMAFVVIELSTRFPSEGGLYVWSKEAFGEFHGFVAGWTYWVYTFFYFPGLLMASAAMGAYVGGPRTAFLAEDRAYLLIGSVAILAVAVYLNLIGLHIGKWLQNAGGIGTYVPLMMLVALGGYLWATRGAPTHFTLKNMLPVWNWDTVNFWPQIAFAFTGLELCSMMSEEVRDPHRTFPRAIVSSGLMIALIYIAGTFAVLAMVPAEAVDPKAGVFQALTTGSTMLRIGAYGVVAAILVTAGNAGGVGTTVAGVARIPFVVGIDRYMPAAFGKIHPKWKTPWVSILVQAVISGLILLVIELNETANSAYQILVDAGTILYFIPLLYMFAAVIKLAYRADRGAEGNASLIPGGKLGVWLMGMLGIIVLIGGIVLSMIPPGEAEHKWLFEVKLIAGTAGALALGLILYFRGARAKAREGIQSEQPQQPVLPMR